MSDYEAAQAAAAEVRERVALLNQSVREAAALRVEVSYEFRDLVTVNKAGVISPLLAVSTSMRLE